METVAYGLLCLVTSDNGTFIQIKSKAVPLRHAGAKGERKYSSYSFLTSALDGESGQRHASTALYPRERTPDTYWIGGWMGLRAGLNTEARGKVLFLCRGSNLCRPVCSHALTDWDTRVPIDSNKKLKLSHYTPRRRLRERRYSSYSFSTSALDGGEWSASGPVRTLVPGKGSRYPLYRRLGGPQSRCEHRS
jgi:hypothetical protein